MNGVDKWQALEASMVGWAVGKAAVGVGSGVPVFSGAAVGEDVEMPVRRIVAVAAFITFFSGGEAQAANKIIVAKRQPIKYFISTSFFII